MGFGGAVQSMISSLKNNEKMRSKRTKFKNTLGGNNSESKTEYNFPEATPEMLKKLRERLQKEQRQQSIKQTIILVVSIIITLFIFSKII
jgi:hypothetical protein